MALRDSKVFRITGYVLIGIFFTTFVLDVLFQVVTGNSLGTYWSPYFVHWTYGSALIVLVALAIVGGIGLAIRIYERMQG